MWPLDPGSRFVRAKKPSLHSAGTRNGFSRGGFQTRPYKRWLLDPYLLDRLGLNSGFGYEYHHYGPYSRDLDNATADAKAFGMIEEDYERRQSDGAMYSIFRLSPDAARKEEAYGELGRERTAELARLFAHTNVTVLELAATIDWLWREEKHRDWQSEITKRKSLKVRHGRLERAVDLLRNLGLTPPAKAAA